ncbi:MAG: hypothetical protein ABGZ17_03810, partial [Planctomycetaceae bacterium]
MLTCSACNARLKKDEVKQGRCPVCGEFLERDGPDLRETWDGHSGREPDEERPGTVPVVDLTGDDVRSRELTGESVREKADGKGDNEDSSDRHAADQIPPHGVQASDMAGKQLPDNGLESRGAGDSTWVSGSDAEGANLNDSDVLHDASESDIGKTVHLSADDADFNQDSASEDAGRIGDSTWIPDGTDLSADGAGNGGAELGSIDATISNAAELVNGLSEDPGTPAVGGSSDFDGSTRPPNSESLATDDPEPKGGGRIGDSTWIPDGTDLSADSDATDAIETGSIDASISNAAELVNGLSEDPGTPTAGGSHDIGGSTPSPDSEAPAADDRASEDGSRIGDSTWIPDGTDLSADGDASDAVETQHIDAT